MIKTDEVISEWEIYSAREFKEVFCIADPFDEVECDEDYIMGHLEADERTFRVQYMTNNNQYEEYWLIQEVKE